jgi:Ca2+/Na+ antiporter
MTETDVEWKQLQQVWNEPDRETDARVAALHRAVSGQALRLRLALVSELLLTLVAVISLVWTWQRVPGTRTAIIIAAALIHTAVIWAYAIWNRSGHWKPVADTLRDAVRVRQSHYRRRLAAYRFVTWLAAVEGALLVLVLAMTNLTPWPIVFALVYLGAAVLWTIWDGKRLRRELDALDRFATEFETE